MRPSPSLALLFRAGVPTAPPLGQCSDVTVCEACSPPYFLCLPPASHTTTHFFPTACPPSLPRELLNPQHLEWGLRGVRGHGALVMEKKRWPRTRED